MASLPIVLLSLALSHPASNSVPSHVPRYVTGAQADRSGTLGRSYAQILAMGESKWKELYAEKNGDSTPALAGAISVYGEALAWRNDRLRRPKTKTWPLRTHLTAYAAELQGVGYAITGGGTLWNIFAAFTYRDVETTLYRVLSGTGKPPRRVVSDAERALSAFAPTIAAIDDRTRRAEANARLAGARKALALVVRDARALTRRDSDTILEFCRKEAVDVAEQSDPL